jgi:hypothetical protein
MVKHLENLTVSLIAALIGFCQLRVIGYKLSADNMSVFLAYVGVAGGISLFLFIVQDFFELKAKPNHELDHEINIRSNSVSSGLDVSHITNVMSILGTVIGVSIQGNLGLLILSILSAVTTFPTIAVIRNLKSYATLNKILLTITLVRFLVILFVVTFVPNYSLIIYSFFVSTIVLNTLLLNLFKRDIKRINVNSDTVNISTIANWAFFWGLFYIDVVVARYFMSGDTAASYALLSFIIKNFFIVQLLPLKEAISRGEFTDKGYGRFLKSLALFILLWIIVTILFMYFQTEISDLFLAEPRTLSSTTIFQVISCNVMFLYIYIKINTAKVIGTSKVLTASLSFILLAIFTIRTENEISHFLLLILFFQLYFIFALKLNPRRGKDSTFV